ncbi:adenosylcobinamide-phosphate synthase CbiB [uncultured Tateyamaria sp.]|uniref:adenosylcobinamide-phosphate synthase CbiB n=1 Tax=uncultured Tateyamaria sp. TaxID=455651 RepID=UPI0026257E8C|nr:adenosylcobinamide-phosphate synthase CbiB [uncultured Tateyamaria sp.]
MNGAIFLALALSLDALMGEPRWLWARLPHPAVLMGRAVAGLDRALNGGASQRLKGVLAVLILVSGAGGLGWVLQQLGPVVSIIAAAILLAQRSLVQHVAAVASGLRQSDEAGRHAVAQIVSRDVSTSDASATSRSAIESLSENFSDGVIAPAFLFLIAGLPGIAIYKVVNTADSMIGYLTPRHTEFGWAAARLDDVLNWVPARLTALLIALVGRSTSQLGNAQRDARLHRSPNAGWPEAAMAYTLDIALAGPRSYHGQVRDLAWVNGAGRRDLGPPDIDAAIAIVWKAWGLSVAICVGIGGLVWVY